MHSPKINFFRFPFLIQKEILLNFSNTEKVLLSLCSKKSAQIIRKLKLNIKKVQYTFGSASADEPPYTFMPSLTVQVLDKHDTEEDVLVFLQYAYSRFPDRGTMLLPIGRMNIRLRYLKTQSANPRAQLQYLKQEKERLVHIIQDHMCFIFPRQHDKQLVIGSCNDPQFLNFLNLNEISLDWGDASNKRLEELIRYHPNLKGLQTGFNNDYSVVKKESPLLSLDKLNLLSSNTINTETVVANFKGQYLCLNMAEGDTSIFMDFVRKWTSGDGYDNIKGVEVLAGSWRGLGMFTDEETVQMADWGEAWDAKRRPRNFVIKERMINPRRDHNHGVTSIFLNEPIDCSRYFDAQRNDGKKLASFFISRREFKFLVWEDSEWNRV